MGGMFYSQKGLILPGKHGNKIYGLVFRPLFKPNGPRDAWFNNRSIPNREPMERRGRGGFGCL